MIITTITLIILKTITINTKMVNRGNSDDYKENGENKNNSKKTIWCYSAENPSPTNFSY